MLNIVKLPNGIIYIYTHKPINQNQLLPMLTMKSPYFAMIPVLSASFVVAAVAARPCAVGEPATHGVFINNKKHNCWIFGISTWNIQRTFWFLGDSKHKNHHQSSSSWFTREMSGAFGKFPQSCFQTNRSLQPAVARAAVALEGRPPDTKKHPVLSGHFASTYGDIF